MNTKIKIGVIADDFTGASDSASFLSKSGAKTIMFTSIPTQLQDDCDAIVLALKSRSVAPSDAISQTKEAVDFLLKQECEKVYFKYCSTFDCTPQGNIGVVLDFIMEYLNLPYTILCPSLPVNGRTVKDGVLYVNGVPLGDSPMKNHPLNPMWDSYIPTLMKPQSNYPCFCISKEDLESNQLDDKIKALSSKQERFYLVPDYETEEDGIMIGKQFQHLSFLSGGSGLLEFVLEKQSPKNDNLKPNTIKQQRSIILCGSCSVATKKQIETYIASGGAFFAVDSKKLLRKELTLYEVFSYVDQQSTTVLVYSSAIEEDMSILKQRDTFSIESNLVETLMAELSSMAVEHGYQTIVVAGGETSGAVTLRLGYDGFQIGESIDPGIPILYPLKNKEIRLILKSGNFGCEDFFMKAIGGNTNECSG